jgi:hypothetical protein
MLAEAVGAKAAQVNRALRVARIASRLVGIVASLPLAAQMLGGAKSS